MTPIAEMVERMLAAGAPVSAILAAITTVETVTRDVTPVSRVTKRDGNRKRQQARRNRIKLQELATEAQANDGADRHASVTRDSVTAAPSGPVVLSSSLLPEEATKEGRKKGSRLLKDARASDADRAFAIENHIPENRVDAEWTEFVDYWIGVPGSRGVKLDWSATWRNRVRQISPRYRGQNGQQPGNNRTNQTSGPPPTRDTAVIAGMGRALERRRAARAADDPGRQDVREERHPGAAGGTDAEPGSAPDDD